MKKIMFLIICICLLMLSGCITPSKNLNVCGDGQCTLTEDCNSCPQDCGCGINDYCSSEGICRTAICGDEICSEEEKSSGTCCQDCGCETDQVCNKITSVCQSKAVISDDSVEKIAKRYLTQNNIAGKIIKIEDIYYEKETAKQVDIDCQTTDSPYPCMITLFINEQGEIIEEVRTS